MRTKQTNSGKGAASIVGMLAVALLMMACNGTREAAGGDDDAAVKAQIQERLVTYDKALAKAYATGNIELLRPFAVEKVLAYVEKRVNDLAARGLVLEAEYRDLTIEHLDTWGDGFALATTLETWNLRYYATGSHALVSEEKDQKSRVQYQLKIVDGKWTIFYRSLKQDVTDQ